MTLLDSVPEHVLRSRWLQWSLLAAGPALVSGVVWAANALQGTAVAPSCGIGGVLLEAADQYRVLDAAAKLVPELGHISAPTSTCHSVPFSADLPNMVLSVTAGLAVSIYVLFSLRIRLLRGDLERSGLFSSRSLQRSGIAPALEAATAPRGRRGIIEDVALAVVSLVGSTAMYFWLYTHGPIFRDLAGSYSRMGSPHVNTELLRQNWWANHQKHPVNTALGIAVGAIGLHFALKQRTVFVRIGRLLTRLRKLPRPVEFVPRWLDQDYGWRPLNGLVTMGYLAIVTFFASFSAALYALRSDQPGLSRLLSVLLGVIAVIAAIANGTFLVSLIATIRGLFADSVAFERTRILAAIRQAEIPTAPRHRRAIDRLTLLTEGSGLADVPNYPIRGRWLRFLGIVPAFLGALWTFSNEVGRAFGL